MSGVTFQGRWDGPLAATAFPVNGTNGHALCKTSGVIVWDMPRRPLSPAMDRARAISLQLTSIRAMLAIAHRSDHHPAGLMILRLF